MAHKWVKSVIKIRDFMEFFFFTNFRSLFKTIFNPHYFYLLQILWRSVMTGYKRSLFSQDFCHCIVDVWIFVVLWHRGNCCFLGPKKQDFWQKINILKGNHCILRIRGAPVHQKLGMILENKVVQKLKLEKNGVFLQKMVS